MHLRGAWCLTWAVCRYCSIKYQSWADVSSNKNWKPAEVMQGGSPGSVLETEDDSGDKQRKSTIPTYLLMLLLVFLAPFSIPSHHKLPPNT